MVCPMQSADYILEDVEVKVIDYANYEDDTLRERTLRGCIEFGGGGLLLHISADDHDRDPGFFVRLSPDLARRLGTALLAPSNYEGEAARGR